MDGNQPVSPVTLQMLNSLIDTQTRLRDAAEARWSFAREAFFNLARLVAAEWLETRQQNKGGLESIRLEELSQVVYQRVSTLQSVSALPDAEQLRKTTERNDELSRHLGDLEEQLRQARKLGQELEASQKQIENLLAENERLKTQNEKYKNISSPQSSDAPFPMPSWFTEWVASKGFEKQSFALKFIGSTGTFLRQDLLEAIANHYHIDFDSNPPKEALEGIEERGFITFSEKETGNRGRPPFAASMTVLGEIAFIFLTRELPRESNFDAIRPFHSTDAHTFLVLKTVKILEAEGYEIISKGEINIPLHDNHLSSPDILARKDGQEIKVEVERDVNKGNSPSREQKWQNAYEAGCGKIYVFCETPEIQKKLIQEINHALAAESRLQRASIFIANVDDVEAGRRHKDGSIWISQKIPAPKTTF